VKALPNPGKDPKFHLNLHPINLLSMKGKPFEKVILKIIQGHIEGRNLHNAVHVTTRTAMYEARGQVTLNFSNTMFTAAVILETEKAFDTTWHRGLLQKVSKLEFSTSIIKLMSSFLSERNSESRWKVKCPRQGICKQGCHKIPSCPPHYITCT
jgi:hypothetical protein